MAEATVDVKVGLTVAVVVQVDLQMNDPAGDVVLTAKLVPAVVQLDLLCGRPCRAGCCNGGRAAY